MREIHPEDMKGLTCYKSPSTKEPKTFQPGVVGKSVEGVNSCQDHRDAVRAFWAAIHQQLSWHWLGSCCTWKDSTQVDVLV